MEIVSLNFVDGINIPQEKGNLENVEVKETTAKEKGLFSRRDFNKGEIIFTVLGETIDYATDYTIPINETEKVEPRIVGSVAQFMNHSCEPNIGPKSNGRDYVAIRDIKKDEELITNYTFLGYDFGDEKSIDGKNPIAFDKTCYCGAKSCKGILRGYKYLTQEEKLKFKDYILPFLLNNKKYQG